MTFKRIVVGIVKRLFIWLPDRLYLQLIYLLEMGHFLNLRDPKTFNQKLQWLKLYNRKPEYTIMVDKYEAKKYVAEIIGEEYIIPTLGVWNSFDEIDFDNLPNQFVLKCTHDSGGLVICKDKSKLDKKAIKKKIEKSLKRNFYRYGREWPYKNVPRRIIAEKYMTNGNNELEDYKVHNFNGTPKVILVCRERFKNSPLIEDFYSDKWEILDIRRPGHPNSPEPMNCPDNLEKMLMLSRELSKDIPFLRTDFYTIENRIYFGELTFFPAAGITSFEPEKWDLIWGDWLKLPLGGVSV